MDADSRVVRVTSIDQKQNSIRKGGNEAEETVQRDSKKKGGQGGKEKKGYFALEPGLL